MGIKRNCPWLRRCVKSGRIGRSNSRLRRLHLKKILPRKIAVPELRSFQELDRIGHIDEAWQHLPRRHTCAGNVITRAIENKIYDN